LTSGKVAMSLITRSKEQADVEVFKDKRLSKQGHRQQFQDLLDKKEGGGDNVG
jgi:hypothetical protein